MRLMATATAGAAALLVTAGAAASETWRMSHKMPPESVEGELFQLFADQVAEKTGGEVEIDVYPSEQLGSDDAVLEQIQLGTIHVYPEGISYLQKWVPHLAWTSAPFLFDDREHWARFMQTDLVAGWLETVEQEAGITVIGDPTAFVRGPYRVMLSSRDWETLEDMQGIKLRMHPDELAAEAWRHLGAEVRTLAWTETYESLGRGIVEAVNSPIALAEPMRFYEVAPHIVRHDEYPQGMAFMASARAWDDLNEETKDQVLAAYDEAAAASQERMGAIADDSIARMQEAGVTYSEIDTSAFVQRMDEMYRRMDAEGEMPEGFLDAVEQTRETTGG